MPINYRDFSVFTGDFAGVAGELPVPPVILPTIPSFQRRQKVIENMRVLYAERLAYKTSVNEEVMCESRETCASSIETANAKKIRLKTATARAIDTGLLVVG